ncbi:N-acetylaspartate synthetase-like [Dendronephthya gigantea]|uniref:N-acetylaspartate synthetase-like n=1 Tax=Dendronephthya gigantea TaxID=151771 RepID=UPI00106BACCB|nr:N-acetylaspartate synthetase-like [Dendronephthya gigantea]XP_028391981.1 N-acetylaspartate synthetase-like [Dendronephthya gigantea]XP_028391989.1 N-acetylaspartate synthetase-like [Dendronephthya gigantea]
MDKLFAVWCLYEYQSPRSTPTVRRKQRVITPKFKVPPKDENQRQVKFRLLTKDDIEIVREIYQQGHQGRIFPAFKIGFARSLSLLTMLILFALVYLATRSLLVSVAFEILYNCTVLASFHKLFNDHISNSLSKDLEDMTEYYKTQETCTRYSDFAKNGSSIWVAVKENVVVGFVSFTHLNEETIELKRMGVAEKFRRNGVGVSLCQFAIQFLQATNYKRILLETTEAHQPAIRLYKKFKFQLIKRQQRSCGLASIHIEHYELPISVANTLNIAPSQAIKPDCSHAIPKHLINYIH